MPRRPGLDGRPRSSPQPAASRPSISEHARAALPTAPLRPGSAVGDSARNAAARPARASMRRIAAPRRKRRRNDVPSRSRRSRPETAARPGLSARARSRAQPQAAGRPAAAATPTPRRHLRRVHRTCSSPNRAREPVRLPGRPDTSRRHRSVRTGMSLDMSDTTRPLVRRRAARGAGLHGVLAVAAALSGVAVAAPHGAGARSCGDVPGEGVTARNVTATHVRCSRALAVANRVGKVSSFGGCVKSVRTLRTTVSPCTRSGFFCHERGHSKYTSHIGCSSATPGSSSTSDCALFGAFPPLAAVSNQRDVTPPGELQSRPVDTRIPSRSPPLLPRSYPRRFG